MVSNNSFDAGRYGIPSCDLTFFVAVEHEERNAKKIKIKIAMLFILLIPYK
jgi:hypothetical protein